MTGLLIFSFSKIIGKIVVKGLSKGIENLVASAEKFNGVAYEN